MEDSTAINLDRDKRYDERVRRSLVARDEADRARSESHITFFDKLAVLSASSIAVAISLIGASLSSKSIGLFSTLTSKGLTLASLGLLFAALSLCIIHNYLELKVYRRMVRLADLTAKQTIANQGFEYGQTWILASHQVQPNTANEIRDEEVKISSLRMVSYRIGFAASLSFLMGYLFVLSWIAGIVVRGPN